MTEILPTTWKDDDFVYVDPDTRTVIGRVEWTQEGFPKSRKFEVAKSPDSPEKKTGKREKKTFDRGYYPWGTYRSMKRIYRLEGKVKDADVNATLDDVLPKALNQAFWG